MALRIRFLPGDVVATGEEDSTLFELGRSLDLPIETACVGKGTCGLCRVRIVDGECNLSSFNDVEEKHLGNVYHLTKVRLACQTRVFGDATVEIVAKRKPKKKSR